jgi:hypothetical protein
MARMLFVVGTVHSVQIELTNPRPALAAKVDRFKAYLERVARNERVSIIAEEQNAENLEQLGITSVPVAVADTLLIEHLFCEASQGERRLRGILCRDDFLHETWEMPRMTDEERRCYIDAREREFFAPRENIWLERLTPILGDRVLFVCGSGHIDTFPTLLHERQIRHAIVCRDWSADDDAAHGVLPLEDRPI